MPLIRSGGLEGLRALEADAFSAMLNRLLPVDEAGFGLVLMWDLLNYLVDDQPSLLARHLAEIAQRGASIHLMTISGETMPAEPSRYEILDAGRLAYRPTTPQGTAALEPLRIERSFLLRHGVREFIAVNG